MPYCYILLSPSRNKYYVGSTHTSLKERIVKHNTSYYGKHFTSQTSDWELYHAIQFDSYDLARKCELHVKKMKSRKYIENLKKYHEMSEKILTTLTEQL